MRKRMGWKKRAAVAVELAVVTPVMLAMLFGIIEFGWLFTVQHTMLNAAREGARFGSLEGVDSTEISPHVQQYLTAVGVDQTATIEVTDPTEADPTVTVRVTIPRDDVSLVGHFFGFSGGTLEGMASMRKEGM